MNINGKLAAAYAQAAYEIHGDGWQLVRRIGSVDAAADQRLREAACRRHWFIITPCNPRSRQLADADNAAHLQDLRQQLDRSARRYVNSLARAMDDKWREAGFCVFDIAQSDARELGRRYEQHAIVRGRLGGAPQLIWLDG